MNEYAAHQPDAPARESGHPAKERGVPVLVRVLLRASVLSTAVLFPASAFADDIMLRETIDREVKAAWANEKLAAPSPMNCPSCPYRHACRAWTG